MTQHIGPIPCPGKAGIRLGCTSVKTLETDAMPGHGILGMRQVRHGVWIWTNGPSLVSLLHLMSTMDRNRERFLGLIREAYARRRLLPNRDRKGLLRARKLGAPQQNRTS